MKIVTLLLISIFSVNSFAQINDEVISDQNYSVYIITLKHQSLSSYNGSIESFAATSPSVTGDRKLDTQSEAAQEYLSFLKQETSAVMSEINQLLGRNVQSKYEYYYANYGVAVRVSDSEANTLKSLSSVLSIDKEQIYELDTDAGPNFIGANTIWDGSNMPASVPNQGEGLIVGVLDTGINMDHPSFSDTPEDGYDFAAANPLGAGNTVLGSACSALNPCNNKLIGVWNYADGPDDTNGHGSHTASTAAGNRITAASIPGGFVSTTGTALDATSISGVAPHAHIIAYDVCITTCAGSSITAAINQAIADGVDVISFSISGGTDPWNITNSDRTYLDAMNAGIVISTSAGNTSSSVPDPVGAVNHRGPWLLSVANSSHNRILKYQVAVTQPTPIPSHLTDIYGLLGVANNFAGDVNAGLTYSGDADPGNETGCVAFPANSFDGKIALIIRGACSFASKIDNAEAAGAVAAIIYNNASDVPVAMGGIEDTSIPAVMIGFADGDAIVSFISSVVASTVEGFISGTAVYLLVDSLGNILNTGSLLGPNESFSVTKPDINGPGTNIFAAYKDGTAAPQFEFLSGTSMSAPHVAGSALLMVKAHPDWSPSEIKAAMMMTADKDVTTSAGNPATPDEVGSGTIDLTIAAKSILTMDETYANYLAADPDNGGTPESLNIPSVRQNNCSGSCSWSRTVTNKSSTDTFTWSTADVKYRNDAMITVTPSSFELAPGASQAFTINYIVCDGTLNQLRFDDVVFEANDNNVPFSRITLAAVPTATGDCSPYDLIFENGFEVATP